MTNAEVQEGSAVRGNGSVRFDERKVDMRRIGLWRLFCIVRRLKILVAWSIAVGALASFGADDRLVAPKQGDTHLDGFVGAKVGRFIDHRVRSDFAREIVFPEARMAFEKQDDDRFFIPAKGDIEDRLRLRHWGMWKGEFWGKLMISACRIAEYEHDADLKKFLHEEALRLIAFQKPDGYLGTYVDPEYVQPLGWDVNHTNTTVKGPWCWNLWCRKYTMWGLLASYKLTGDRRLLEATMKSMDQEMAMLSRLGLHPIDTGTFVGMPSSSVLKPLLLLYRETNKREYLQYAKAIVDDFRRADGRAPNIIANAFSRNPLAEWYAAPWAWAKAYEMMSCCDGLLEYYRLTGDESVLEAMKRVHAMIEEHETNPCFSVGYNDQFANAAKLLNGVTEPCDVIHWIRFNHDLWLITGEPKYVDAIELGFYNAYLASVFRDGTWGARGVRSHGYHHAERSGQSGMRHQHCCVNNMPRSVVDVAQTLVAKDAEGTLYVAFYNDGHALIGGDKVEISGNYPVGDKVTVKVSRMSAGKIKFRIPAWSSTDVDRGTWRTVDAPAGESVYELAFDLRPRLWAPKRQAIAGQNAVPGMLADWRTRMWTAYGSDKDIAKMMRTVPGVEIMRGPLVLAKSEAADTPLHEICSEESIYGTMPVLKLTDVKASKTWGHWELEIGDGGRRVPVCDFMSAGDEYKDGGCCFSIWF